MQESQVASSVTPTVLADLDVDKGADATFPGRFLPANFGRSLHHKSHTRHVE